MPLHEVVYEVWDLICHYMGWYTRSGISYAITWGGIRGLGSHMPLHEVVYEVWDLICHYMGWYTRSGISYAITWGGIQGLGSPLYISVLLPLCLFLPLYLSISSSKSFNSNSPFCSKTGMPMNSNDIRFKHSSLKCCQEGYSVIPGLHRCTVY